MKHLSFLMTGCAVLTLAACSGGDAETDDAVANDIVAENVVDEPIEALNEVEEAVEEAAAPPPPPPIAEEDLTVEDAGTEDVPGM